MRLKWLQVDILLSVEYTNCTRRAWNLKCEIIRECSNYFIWKKGGHEKKESDLIVFGINILIFIFMRCKTLHAVPLFFSYVCGYHDFKRRKSLKTLIMVILKYICHFIYHIKCSTWKIHTSALTLKLIATRFKIKIFSAKKQNRLGYLTDINWCS